MRLTLGTKLILTIAAIAAVAIVIAATTLVFMEVSAATFRETISESLPSLKAAEEIEITLSDKDSDVSAYLLSKGDRVWLERLRASRAEGKSWLASAREHAVSSKETELLDRLDKVLAEYDAKCDKVIAEFDHGHRDEAASALRDEVWPVYRRAYRQCEELIDVVDGNVRSARERAHRYGVMRSWCVSLSSLLIVGLAVVLVWLLIRRVFIPLRRLAADARIHVGYTPDGTGEMVDDEVRSVGDYFRTVMADAANTRTALAESRSRMWNAEKLAALGKLTASVAHEMRNPLSSMKMWLYSIRKTAGAEPTLDHKYQILADEINRLESIVRSVLEFSRPPSLQPQAHSIVQIIDKTMEIVRPWLDGKNIQVVQDHTAELPQVMADSEQLKQVFVNLLDNAAEAMPEGGEISISSRVEAGANGSEGIVVRVRDTGHGIPDEVQSRLFEPFFTTKVEGTGLGLCITANILAAQEGQLVLESSTAGSTTFAIRLPIAMEKSDEQDSCR